MIANKILDVGAKNVAISSKIPPGRIALRGQVMVFLRLLLLDGFMFKQW